MDTDCFEYHPDFLVRDYADSLLQCFWRELGWMQKEITIFGRRVMQPRLIAWYGDSTAGYTYSGLELQPANWHPELLKLKFQIEEFTGQVFNSVLANAYRDGADSMGWHRDNEAELGRCPYIASLSLGQPRRFLVKPVVRKGDGAVRSRGLTLDHGSLLLMKGVCQEKYMHSLPKTRRACMLRINLTFREIRSPA